MAITYASNTITLTTGNYTLADIYAADQAGGWGVFLRDINQEKDHYRTAKKIRISSGKLTINPEVETLLFPVGGLTPCI